MPVIISPEAAAALDGLAPQPAPQTTPQATPTPIPAPQAVPQAPTQSVPAPATVDPLPEIKLDIPAEPQKPVDSEARIKELEAKLAKFETDRAEEATKQMNEYIYASVKGEQNFKTMAAYLKANLPEGDIKALNELLGSGDKAKVNLALSQAVTTYNKLKGNGNLMQGDVNIPAPTIEPMSKDEYQKICSTEKYQIDSSYRRQVDERRLRTLQSDKQKFLPGQYWTREASGLRRI